MDATKLGSQTWKSLLLIELLLLLHLLLMLELYMLLLQSAHVLLI